MPSVKHKRLASIPTTYGFPLIDQALGAESRHALAPGHSLQWFGVASTLHGDLGSCPLDVTKIVRRQFDGKSPEVFFQPMESGGARNGNDPRLLSEQPGKRDLSRRRLLLLCNSAEQLNQHLVRFPVLIEQVDG